MTYRLNYHNKAKKQLKKLDPQIRKQILLWLDKHVNDTIDPRQYGKALTGSLADLWRYRVGNYRIICQIKDDQLLVMTLAIDHRSKVYKLKIPRE